MTVTRDQAKRIAQAIFDDIELSRCLSLDRVTDVIERTARMDSTPQSRLASELQETIEGLVRIELLAPPTEEDVSRAVQMQKRDPGYVVYEAPGPFGGTIIATTPELAKMASQLLDFCKTPRQTIIQPDD